MTIMKHKKVVNSSLISDVEDLEKVFKIREIVFVDEQNVSKEDEFDEFEETSRHFLATIDNVPVGAARWRKTEKGIKLERFAVLQKYRGKGVGESLVTAVMDDINGQENNPKGKCYLHAQVTAIPFYSKLGFAPYGDQFDECNIMHQSMVY